MSIGGDKSSYLPMAQRGGDFLRTVIGPFVALALALAVTGRDDGLGATGAHIWFWARVFYVPAYALGVPFLRTAIWTISIVGLVVMLVALI